MTTTTDQQPDDTQQPDPAEGQQPDDLDEGQQPDEDGQGAEQPERDPVAAREQRLRARAREAETERDGLRERLGKYQRAEVEAVAAEVLAHGGDLLAVRPDLAALLGEDGHVDPAKVRAAAQAVVTERPHWGRDTGEEDGRRMARGRPRPSGTERTRPASWASVMAPSGNAGMQ